MGGVYAGARGAKPLHDDFIRARGAKHLMHGNASIFEYPVFCVQSWHR